MYYYQYLAYLRHEEMRPEVTQLLKTSAKTHSRRLVTFHQSHSFSHTANTTFYCRRLNTFNNTLYLTEIHTEYLTQKYSTKAIRNQTVIFVFEVTLGLDVTGKILIPRHIHHYRLVQNYILHLIPQQTQRRNGHML